eukprot:CAMPEP_0179323304 /NCGR_PEP_ID=MMETSP0797-20121207/59643_1 /TAXON_ID=47934 /ORGANISM="Dinophysis acuminata, Strain DAEP01" /LENGTH=44 /DNA_ID= /DNA_START= /DNA_END= /DNA_ORIENTATION=
MGATMQSRNPRREINVKSRIPSSSSTQCNTAMLMPVKSWIQAIF